MLLLRLQRQLTSKNNGLGWHPAASAELGLWTGTETWTWTWTRTLNMDFSFDTMALKNSYDYTNFYSTYETHRQMEPSAACQENACHGVEGAQFMRRSVALNVQSNA